MRKLIAGVFVVGALGLVACGGEEQAKVASATAGESAKDVTETYNGLPSDEDMKAYWEKQEQEEEQKPEPKP